MSNIEMVLLIDGTNYPKDDAYYIEKQGYISKEEFDDGGYVCDEDSGLYYHEDDCFYIENLGHYIGPDEYESGDYGRCCETGDYYENEYLIFCEDINDYVCQSWFDNNGSSCADCGECFADTRLEEGDGGEYYCSHCIDDHIDLDESGDDAVSGYIETTNPEYAEKIPYILKEKEQPKNAIDFLKNFYGKRPYKLHNYFAPVKEQFTIKISLENKAYDRYQKICYFLQNIKNLSQESKTVLLEGFKYSRKNVVRSEGIYVYLNYVDLLGKQREVKESIFSIFNYTRQYLKKFGITDLVDIDCSKESFDADEYNVIMSNDIDHKIFLADNNDNLRSCQIRSNRGSLSKGMRDFISSDTHIPLSIHNKGTLIGRQTARLMYDESGRQIIMLDRIYTRTGKGGNHLGRIYRGIAEELYKLGYDLAIPKKTTHDVKSVEGYLNYTREDWDPKPYVDVNKTSIRSAKRTAVINCSYYHDSLSKAMSAKGSNLFYDYLFKENFILLTHDQNGPCKKTIAFDESSAEHGQTDSAQPMNDAEGEMGANKTSEVLQVQEVTA